MSNQIMAPPLPPSSPSPSLYSSCSPEPSYFVTFNQDHTCFACTGGGGFKIFNSDPFREMVHRELQESGRVLSWLEQEQGYKELYVVEVLFRSNIVAFVGGGRSSRYPRNKVMLWDDHQGRCIGELPFATDVRGLRLRRDRIVVVLEYNIYAYDFAELKLLYKIPTLPNPNAICALSPAPNSCVLACPGLHRGEVRLELFSLKQTRFFQAHTTSLACLSLCQNGTILATASIKGTLVRIFNTTDGSKLREFRRGADRADIYSLVFSSDSHYLAASSDKGTIHVFSLRTPWSALDESKDIDHVQINSTTSGILSSSIRSTLQLARSSLLFLASPNSGLLKGVLPKYFSSEWSFAQFRLPEETYSIVAFGAQTNTVVVVCANGSYYRCTFDPTIGGEMLLREHEKYMRVDAQNM